VFLLKKTESTSTAVVIWAATQKAHLEEAFRTALLEALTVAQKPKLKHTAAKNC
jgi:hypothetical protein